MKNNKFTNQLDNLPFDEVKTLYYARLFVESTNDIKGRTQLLRDYPELFDENIWSELKMVFDQVIKLQQKKANNKTTLKDET